MFTTPDVAGARSGLRSVGRGGGIANTALVLCVLVLACGALVMSHETLQTWYAAKEIASRIVVVAVAPNASLLLVAHATNLTNAFSVALLGQVVTPAAGTAVMRPAMRGIRDGWSHA